MEAQSLVKEVMRWRVGNCMNIKIWEDKWLPTSPTYKIQSPRLFLQSDTRVGELINKENGCWKMEVLDSLFYPHKAEVIKGIPLSTQLPRNKLAWTASSHGRFTVSSAYILAEKLAQSAHLGSSSDNSQVRRFWRKIWAFPMPHKIRNFNWRAFRELLPTKVNLKRRKILQDSICDICKLEEETTTHVLWNCEIARETWACTKVSTPVGVSDGWTFQDILWHMFILDHVEEARVAMVVTVAWVLWCNRNVIRTREKRSQGGRWLIGQQFICWQGTPQQRSHQARLHLKRC